MKTAKQICRDIILRELNSPEWGVTQQYLEKYNVKSKEGDPELIFLEDAEGADMIVFVLLEGVNFTLTFYMAKIENHLYRIKSVYPHPGAKVYFWVSSADISIEEMLDLISLSPVSIKRKGETQARIEPAEENSIRFEPDADIPGLVEFKLSRLLNYLEPVKRGIVNLKKKGDAGINIAYYGHTSSMSGLHLDIGIINKLDDLELELDIDLYAEGEEF